MSAMDAGGSGLSLAGLLSAPPPDPGWELVECHHPVREVVDADRGSFRCPDCPTFWVEPPGGYTWIAPYRYLRRAEGRP